MLVLVIGACGVVASRAEAMRRHESVFAARGVQTTATVSGTHALLVYGSGANISYKADDTAYDADVPVDKRSRFPDGATISVVYDPVHPGHVRPVQGWDPTYRSVIGWLCVLGAIAVIGIGRRAANTALAVRSVRSGTARGTTMRVESFWRRQAWQRYSRPWVAVWPDGADWSEDPDLYVPVAWTLGSRAIRVEQASTVYGPPEPGEHLVILHDGRLLWPRGRARRREPGRLPRLR